MSSPGRLAVRGCAHQLRTARCPLVLARTGHGVAAATAAAAVARRHSSTEIGSASPKIAAIVDQISQLTLLETADLVTSLKSRLNIPDMPMGGFMAAAQVAAPAAAAAEEEADSAPAVVEKTLFTLKLAGFETASKAKVIKEVKSLLGLSLVDSKKFVESAPKMLKENVPKEDAEKIMATMKGIGATVTME